jgi:hypothetical protein
MNRTPALTKGGDNAEVNFIRAIEQQVENGAFSALDWWARIGQLKETRRRRKNFWKFQRIARLSLVGR